MVSASPNGSTAGEATYTPIATTTIVGNSTNTVTFNSVSGYTDLILVCNVRMTGASGSKIRFNGDTSGNYSFTTMQGYVSTATSYRPTGTITSIYNNLVWGDATVANGFTPITIQLQSYSNSSFYKKVLWRSGSSSQADGNGDLCAIVGLWRNTNPITSIELSCWNAVYYVEGSTFTVYGIKAA